MAHCDAAGVNGSNRILSHGAPLPNGCLGSPELVLLFGLDIGFLMDGCRTDARKPSRLNRPLFMLIQRQMVTLRLSLASDEITFPPFGDEPRHPRVLHRPHSALPLPETLPRALGLQAGHVRQDGGSESPRCVQGLPH